MCYVLLLFFCSHCLGTHACSELAQCTDTIGSYRCQCAPGFLGDGHMKCMDLDECLYGFHDCGVGSVANCVNIPGSFFCRCDTGWSGDAKKCEDVDECASASACPGNNTVCSNTVGSYTCSCADGFSASAVQEVDGTMQCVDHDECLEASLTGCDANADCVNLPGTYHCACRTGYTGDGKACVPGVCTTLLLRVNAFTHGTFSTLVSRCMCLDGT